MFDVLGEFLARHPTFSGLLLLASFVIVPFGDLLMEVF